MTDTAEKPQRARSRAYPGATLEDCVGFVTQVKRNLGKGTHDRQSLANALGFDAVTGAVNQRVAAMVHFGLLNRAAGGYELSAHSSRITDPLDDEEKQQELRNAFSRPTLYHDLLEKFRPDGGVPLQLATHLHRFHGITDAASRTAADIFMQSGVFAGVLDREGKIIYASGNRHPEQTAPNVETLGSAERQNSESEGGGARPPASSQLPPRQPPPIVPQNPVGGVEQLTATQRFEFAITGGRTVSITVPAELSEKDLKIIRKQIELLELQAGMGEDA